MKGRLIFKAACLLVVLAVVAAVSGFAVQGQAADKKVSRLAHVYAPDHPFNDGMKEMAERKADEWDDRDPVFPGAIGSEETSQRASPGDNPDGYRGPGELGRVPVC